MKKRNDMPKMSPRGATSDEKFILLEGDGLCQVQQNSGGRFFDLHEGAETLPTDFEADVDTLGPEGRVVVRKHVAGVDLLAGAEGVGQPQDGIAGRHAEVVGEAI